MEDVEHEDETIINEIIHIFKTTHEEETQETFDEGMVDSESIGDGNAKTIDATPLNSQVADNEKPNVETIDTGTKSAKRQTEIKDCGLQEALQPCTSQTIRVARPRKRRYEMQIRKVIPRKAKTKAMKMIQSVKRAGLKTPVLGKSKSKPKGKKGRSVWPRTNFDVVCYFRPAVSTTSMSTTSSVCEDCRYEHRK